MSDAPAPMVRQASDSHAPVAGLDSSQQLLAPGMLVDAAAAAPAPGPALPDPANHSPQLVLDIANRHEDGEDEEDEDDDEDEEDDIRSASPLEMSCRRSPTRDLTPPPAAASATAAASCLSAGPPPSAGAFGELLLDLPTELISNIVIFLPSPRLVAFAQCCQRLSAICELEFQRRCRQHGRRLPRRPRGDFVTTGSPWRLLYCSYLCKSCRKEGEWPVYTGTGQRQLALLCKDCVLFSTHVRKILSAESLRVATESIYGHKLFRKSSKRARPNAHAHA